MKNETEVKINQGMNLTTEPIIRGALEVAGFLRFQASRSAHFLGAAHLLIRILPGFMMPSFFIRKVKVEA